MARARRLRRRRRSRPTASARRRFRPASRRRTLTAINPADVPDELNQVSGSIGGPLVKDKTFFFATGRLHAAGSDDVPLADAAGVRAAARRQPRPTSATTVRSSFNARRRSQAVARAQTLMWRVQRRSHVTTPIPTTPSSARTRRRVARRYTRGVVDDAGEPHGDAGLEPPQRSAGRAT